MDRRLSDRMDTLPFEVKRKILSYIPAHGATPENLETTMATLPKPYFWRLLEFKRFIAVLEEVNSILETM